MTDDEERHLGLMSAPIFGWSSGNRSPRRPRILSQLPPPPAFVNPNGNSILVRTRQVGRSLEFWGRVISIWTSFKVTQAYVALQRRYRTEGWTRRVWNAQHERAGDVSLHGPQFISLCQISRIGRLRSDLSIL